MSTLPRRSFFMGAALAASAARVIGANDKVKIGIVGLGGRGSDHLRMYVTIPTAQVAGLCDVNQAARERAQARLKQSSPEGAKEFVDMREMFASKAVDAVSIATPNHWHALSTIWACEAGKDVYCEKPASYNIWEGWRMTEAARRTNRIVQVGMQSRSTPHKRKAIEFIQGGGIGKLYLAKGLCYKRRKSIGHTPEEPTPPGIDWNLFLGPAPMRPFTKNRFAYNWHWFWDTGNGDIGNQGVHEMDIARWGMGDVPFPKSVSSTGGKYIYNDDQETPNTQHATLSFPDSEIEFEVRGLLTGPEGGLPVRPGNTVGNLFYGADGWMWLDERGFQVYKGESNEKIMDEKAVAGINTSTMHMENFVKACLSRNPNDLNAEVAKGADSAAYFHLANIAYRTGKRLDWDAAKKKFVNAPDADALITRNYRKPFVVS